MSLQIRLARADDLAVLPVLEASAAQAFRGSTQRRVVDDPVPAPEVYAPFVAKNLSWIAKLDNEPVGFVMCEAFADALHVWELAVRQDRQRKGLGQILMARAIQAASALALPAVTLSTFRSIPWNAPSTSVWASGRSRRTIPCPGSPMWPRWRRSTGWI